MRTLTLALPLSLASAGSEFSYVLSSDGSSVQDHGTAPLALLPRAATLVLVAPAAALSWHQVKVPPIAAGRLRAALDGLLEERLLDDMEQLALAVGPRRAADGSVTVAVCDKSWLRGALELFEQARWPVSRVVPQFSPAHGGSSGVRLHAIGAAEDASLVVIDALGATCLPLTTAPGLLGSVPWDLEHTPVVSEPGVSELAERVLARPVSIRSVAQGLLESSASDWELAQFDLAISSGGRIARQWAQVGQKLWRAPAWRLARYGLAGLLLIHLVGLNAWAWKQDALIQSKQREVGRVLSQSFPKVGTIVDAPLQMERALTLMRQSSGAPSARDMDAMLSALGSALPDGQNVDSIEYSAGELAIKGLDLKDEQLDPVRDKLEAQGIVLKRDGDRWVLRAGDPS